MLFLRSLGKVILFSFLDYQIGPDPSEKSPELFFDLPEFSYETITLPSGYGEHFSFEKILKRIFSEAEVRMMKPPHFNKDDKYPGTIFERFYYYEKCPHFVNTVD